MEDVVAYQECVTVHPSHSRRGIWTDGFRFVSPTGDPMFLSKVAQAWAERLDRFDQAQLTVALFCQQEAVPLSESGC